MSFPEEDPVHGEEFVTLWHSGRGAPRPGSVFRRMWGWAEVLGSDPVSPRSVAAPPGDWWVTARRLGPAEEAVLEVLRG